MEPIDIITIEGDVIYMIKDLFPDRYGRHICPCGNPPRIVSLSFEAGFCTFSCLSKMWSEYEELMG